MDISGLEINDFYLRAVKLGRSRGYLKIERIAEIQLNPGIIVNGRLKDPNQFSSILSSFLKKNHFSSSNWMVSIPDSVSFTAYKLFPLLAEDDLKEAVEINSVAILPGKEADISWGWQEIEPVDKSSNKEVVISSISKYDLNQYISSFGKIGIVPVAIEPKSFSIARVFGKTENTLIINIEASTLNFTIIKNGFTRFSREITINSPSEEQFKKLVAEIRKVTNFYLTEKKEEKISKIVLDGSGAKLELKNPLAEALKIPIQISGEIFQIGGFRIMSLPLIGIGLRALIDLKDDNSLSLLPVGTKEATEEKRALLFYGGLANIIVITCLLLILIFGGSFVLQIYLNQKVTSQIAAISQSQVNNTKGGTSDTEKKLTEIKPYIDQEAAVESQIIYVSNALKSLQDSAPAGVIITQLTIQNGTAVNLSGVAQSRESLVSYRDKLSSLENVSNVQMPSSNFSNSNNINFTMTITLANKGKNGQ